MTATNATQATQGMKAADLQPCALCGKGVMHGGLPLFWRVSLERMGVDLAAARQMLATETFFGNVALARVFTDPQIATPVAAARIVLVCESCAGEMTSVYQLGLPNS